MRKLLLSLAILGGAVLATPSAEAAPLAQPIPVLDAPASVQPVQYYRHGRGYNHRRYYARRNHRQYRRY